MRDAGSRFLCNRSCWHRTRDIHLGASASKGNLCDRIVRRAGFDGDGKECSRLRLSECFRHFIVKVLANYILPHTRLAGASSRTLPTLNQDAVIGALKGATFAIEKFRDWIEGGGVLYIPLISEMFKLVTGHDLQIGKAMFFMVAIPVSTR